jgi:hypothetical protein
MPKKRATQTVRLDAKLHQSLKSVASGLGIKLEQAIEESVVWWIGQNKLRALKALKGAR